MEEKSNETPDSNLKPLSFNEKGEIINKQGNNDNTPDPIMKNITNVDLYGGGREPDDRPDEVYEDVASRRRAELRQELTKK